LLLLLEKKMMPSKVIIDDDMVNGDDRDEITAAIPTTETDPPIFPFEIEELNVTFLICPELVKFNMPSNTKSAIVNGCWRSITKTVEAPVETNMTMPDNSKSQMVVNVAKVELGNSKPTPSVKLTEGSQFEELLHKPF